MKGKEIFFARAEINPCNASGLNNVKYIFCDKDKLARYNPVSPLLAKKDINKDIFILNETGHFPYFEDPSQLEKVLITILKET